VFGCRSLPTRSQLFNLPPFGYSWSIFGDDGVRLLLTKLLLLIFLQCAPFGPPVTLWVLREDYRGPRPNGESVWAVFKSHAEVGSLSEIAAQFGVRISLFGYLCQIRAGLTEPMS
jgi:hypothetical protein